MKAYLLLFYFLTKCISAADLSAEYFALKNSYPITDDRLKEYKILVIPGVLAESFITKSNNLIKLRTLFSEGFKDQVEYLKNIEADYEFVKLETETPPEENAKKIIFAIETSNKPILIYSHSKGGLDTLEAFRQRPDLIENVHGWISVQTPFYGAPIASKVQRNHIYKGGANNLFRIMGGNRKGLSSLTIEERSAIMDDIYTTELIVKISSQMKFINLATTKKNLKGYDTPLELFRNYSEKKAGANDGVVPLKSALLYQHGFNIDYVIEENVDHLMTMTNFYILRQPYDREAHTAAALRLLIQ